MAVAISNAVELVLDAKARIGECPLWDTREGLLVWVDIERGEFHRLDPATGRDEAFAVGAQVGAAVPRRSGGYVLALENGFASYEPGGQPALLAAVEPDDPDTRLNDARCDAAGRLWGGTLERDLAPGRGSLYCLEPDGTLRTVLTGVTASNGLDWSPDWRTLYYVDSHAYSVQEFEFDVVAGGLGPSRSLVRWANKPWVFPDGITVDGEGFLWVAVFGTGRVHRYSPEGRLDRIVEVPARLVTSCGFGGSGLDVLYITSATHVLEPGEAERQPYAGAIFSHQPGVRGRPQHAIAGCLSPAGRRRA
jgi:sugar lactone lactonase YvrE